MGMQGLYREEGGSYTELQRLQVPSKMELSFVFYSFNFGATTPVGRTGFTIPAYVMFMGFQPRQGVYFLDSAVG